MAARSRRGSDDGQPREEVPRARQEERPPERGSAPESAHAPALEPEPGVELHVGEDPGGVPDP